MLQQELILQAKDYEGAIYRGLMETATAAKFDSLFTCIAYATKVGCKVVSESLQDRISQWSRMKKDWLISIDYGITEPDALEYLADLPNSRVWIPNADDLIGRHLRPRRSFHKKLYVFDCLRKQDALGIFSGSANLTLGGLYLNDEQATSLVWTSPLSRSEETTIGRARQEIIQLRSIVASTSQLNTSLLKQYRLVWRSRSTKSKDDQEITQRITEPNPHLSISRSAILATASNYWVDVKYVVENLGPGVPGNQIDLLRGSRVFFGFGAGEVPRNTVLGKVRIRYDDEVIDCNMRFGNNQMDKLNLPVPGSPRPVTYHGQTLLFHRNTDDTFALRVAGPKDISQWKSLSQRQGTLFSMRSGRGTCLAFNTVWGRLQVPKSGETASV